MPKINVLDRHVADLIAAGEVVERPASAVKELVENAVDAGATLVTVEIQNGGMTYLRVTDNGCGMAPEDAETAFLRHATSKLRTKEDLAAIGTLGFRGEALAAIASVSKIELMTKTADGEGLSLELEAGTVVDRSPVGCPNGTTIVVRDLFYNTPARLKFMKRDSVEASHVAGALQRQALAHTDVSFRLIKDGETVLNTAGNGDLHGTIYQVYGRQLATAMLPVKSQWEQMKLWGFVTKPTETRGNRNNQQFFVNGRPIKSKLLTSALEQAYQHQMMVGRFPSCVLCLEMPPEALDVNVHPAKTEVKFANEKAVFDCLHYGVLSVLNKAPGRPEMKLQEKKAAAPVSRQETFRTMDVQQYRDFLSKPAEKPIAPIVAEKLSQPVAAPAPTPRAAVPVPPLSGGCHGIAVPGGLPDDSVLPKPEKPVVDTTPRPLAADTPLEKGGQDRVCAPVIPAPAPAPVQPEVQPQPEPEQIALDMPQEIPYRVIGEVLNCYIILEQGDDVYFMDKHAAHERILFEKLKAEERPIMSQELMVPVSANLTEEEAAVLLDHGQLLERCGFELDEFGGGTVLLRRLPADLDESQSESVLQEMAQALLEGHQKDPGDLRDALLHTIACKAAIKAGWHTEPAERDALVKQVMSREDIKYCPHGRPVMITLTRKQLERQFKRA